jgi:Protein of unknown function (DUF2924)
LRDLDVRGLRARWQSVFQRPAPLHLPRHLLFAVVAFRIQADRLGDLDYETRKVLDRTRVSRDNLDKNGASIWMRRGRPSGGIIDADRRLGKSLIDAERQFSFRRSLFY